MGVYGNKGPLIVGFPCNKDPNNEKPPNVPSVSSVSQASMVTRAISLCEPEKPQPQTLQTLNLTLAKEFEARLAEQLEDRKQPLRKHKRLNTLGWSMTS